MIVSVRRHWMPLVAVVIAAILSALATDLVVSGGSSAAAAAVDTHGFPSGPGQPGIFTDRCGYSHSAADDPIMMPGKTGLSMQHDFYGNTATSAATTAASLVGGSSTCSTTADASAYWTPVLFSNGQALKPQSTLIYWRRAQRSAATMHSLPAGLQMIAGDEKATSPQSTSVIAWTCSGTVGTVGTVGPRSATSTPHSCNGGQDLRLTVTFPSCWDGKTLTGAAQTNVVYAEGGTCPASHPDLIPQVVFHVVYPTSSASGLSLSTGPTTHGSVDTAHVDFMNGWTQSTLNADVAACDATSTRCGPVSGPDATPQGPNPRVLAQQRGMAMRRRMTVRG